MSNVSEWANRLRRTSTSAIDLIDEINSLYAEMDDNANRYHELKFAAMEPPETPPPISLQDAMKQWLEDAGVVGTFPNLTSHDYWLAALALDGMKGSLSAEDRESLYWAAQ